MTTTADQLVRHQLDTFHRLGLTELVRSFERPQTRRLLNADEANDLIAAWKFGRRHGEDVGECWSYLGWRPEELEHFTATGEVPTSD